MKLIEVDPTLAQRPDIGSGVSGRAHALAYRSVSELSPGELAFCLRQNIAVPYVAAHALAALSRQALLEAELYPGDLLLSVIHAARSGRLDTSQIQELFDICATAMADVNIIVSEVEPAVNAFIAGVVGQASR